MTYLKISQESIDTVTSIPVIDLAYTMGEKLVRKGKQFQVACPDPNHSENVSDNAYIDPTRNIFKCFSCGCGGNNAIAYFAIKTFGSYEPKKHFIQSVKGIAELMGITLKMEDGSFIGDASSDYKPKKFVPQKELEPQSPQELDMVYRSFLGLCPVREHHLADWRNVRRFSDEQINLLGLRSVPSKDEWVNIYIQLANAGISLERVPGFSQVFVPSFYETPFPEALGEKGTIKSEKGSNVDGAWFYTPAAHNGYFIPVRDENGYIIRLRIRKDEGEPKYIWFSSEHNIDIETNMVRKRKNGVSSGGPLNIAVPFNLLQNWKMGDNITSICKMDTIIATEGEFKSNISANVFGVPVIGLPGAGNFKELLPLLKKWGVKKLIIAYDMDTLQKDNDSLKAQKKQENLFTLVKNFSLEVMQTGVTTCLWTWGISDGKGLDDLVYNRKLPAEINLNTGGKRPVTFANIREY